MQYRWSLVDLNRKNSSFPSFSTVFVLIGAYCSSLKTSNILNEVCLLVITSPPAWSHITGSVCHRVYNAMFLFFTGVLHIARRGRHTTYPTVTFQWQVFPLDIHSICLLPSQLLVPRYRLSIVGTRLFRIAVSTIWNRLASGS